MSTVRTEPSRRTSIAIGAEIAGAWRGLRRSWRGGELGLLAVSLTLAVAIVAGIAGFSDRLNRAIENQSHYFLAADRVLTSTLEVDEKWLVEAERLGLSRAKIVSFRSMVFSQHDGMQLVSLRAVSSAYPLLGAVTISAEAFGETTEVASGPKPGEVWLDSRLFPLLGIRVGDEVDVGEARLRVGAALIKEPDGGNAMDVYGSRALMHLDDLAATDVVQPGSLVSYRYLFSGNQERLDDYAAWLQPQLSDRQKWKSVSESQPAMASVLQRAERYLLLAASLGVALAGAAIAQAARLYGQRNIETVAIMKTLGASRARILRFYFAQILFLASIASAIGLLLAGGVQWLMLLSLRELLMVALPPLGMKAPMLGVLTAFVCCVVFAAPPFLKLSRISPQQVLRRDTSERDGSVIASVAIGLMGMGVLMYLFSRDAIITFSLMAAVASLVIITAVLVLLLIAVVRRRLGGVAVSPRLRLAVASIYRRRYANAFQVASFALALTAVLSLSLLRETLLNDWNTQLADDTPNHFLINIQPSEVQPIADFLSQRGMTHAGLFPMVRGRLTMIDGQTLSDIVGLSEQSQRFDREMNLSWAAELAPDNELIAGEWWGAANTVKKGTALTEPLPVSVEKEVAEDLHLQIGSVLSFDVGGLPLQAKVQSLRSLKWESMRPNFFFIFPPNSLETFASSFITSFYLPPNQKPVLAELLQQFPTLTLIELDALLAQIQLVVRQLSMAVGLVLILVLGCSLLVCVANVRSSMFARLQETALLRALGAGNALLNRILLIEFASIGALAGLLAASTASGLVCSLQLWALDMSPTFHPIVLIIGPIAGSILVSLVAWRDCRAVLAEPALAVLQRV